ncbi:unnamed protein product [Allacma fusca]|uniref:F-box domain-containing protein n=1 Tax=Allacma fusca TaxID=39272 RepID=A0A8J2PBG1_9HEXA|nr:unnamed protein product [Allacma fusca]
MASFPASVGTEVTSTLSIDLILTEILSNLCQKELLVCSLVSKKWNLFARKILRDQKICLAEIHAECPCKNLKDLDGLLQTVGNNPFNGLSITLQKTRGCDIVGHECIGSSGVSDLYSTLLEKLTVKHLKINWLGPSNCPAAKLIENIFQERRSILKGLAIQALPYVEEINAFFKIEEKSKNNWLPKLEMLEIPYGINETLLYTLLDGAPQLKEILGAINPREVELLMGKNKAHLIKEFEFQLVPGDIPVCLNFASLQPKLHKLMTSLEGYLPSGSMSSFCEVLKKLLESSNKLQILKVDLLSLIWIASVGISETRNISQLQIAYDDTIDTNLNCFSLGKVNLIPLFPKIKSVIITFKRLGLDDTREFLPQEFQQIQDVFVCPNVKSVAIEGSDFMPPNFRASVTRCFPSASILFDPLE